METQIICGRLKCYIFFSRKFHLDCLKMWTSPHHARLQMLHYHIQD